MATAGLGTGLTFYNKALDEPEGFHSYMYGFTHWAKNGKWPTRSEIIGITQAKNETLKDWASKSETNTNEDLVKKGLDLGKTEIDKSSNKFLSDGNDSGDTLEWLFSYLNSFLSNIFYPAPVAGYLNDLIGQQILIFLSLLIISVSIFLLFIVFVINVYFLFYKDKFNAPQNNKYLKYYIKYQSFFARLALIYLPVLICIGFFVIIHGLHFLITHQCFAPH